MKVNKVVGYAKVSSIEKKFAAKYSNYLSDFKTMSYDKEHPCKVPLCADTHHKHYNFDEIVKKEYPSSNPASPDTIIVKNDTIYCIEFKNLTGKKTNKYKKKIEQKLIKGKEVLQCIFKKLNEDIENFTFIFCVVFKSTANERDYANDIGSRAIHFDLEKHKGKYFDDIITRDVGFFKRQFIEKIGNHLPKSTTVSKTSCK